MEELFVVQIDHSENEVLRVTVFQKEWIPFAVEQNTVSRFIDKVMVSYLARIRRSITVRQEVLIQKNIRIHPTKRRAFPQGKISFGRSSVRKNRSFLS